MIKSIHSLITNDSSLNLTSCFCTHQILYSWEKNSHFAFRETSFTTLVPTHSVQLGHEGACLSMVVFQHGLLFIMVAFRISSMGCISSWLLFAFLFFLEQEEEKRKETHFVFSCGAVQFLELEMSCCQAKRPSSELRDGKGIKEYVN